jgi:hypothetical protein
MIAALLFGGLFARDSLPPVEVADVSVITEEQFAALTQPDEAPETATDAVQPELPEPDEAPEAPEPAPIETPSQPDLPDPVAEPDVPEDAPVEPTPPAPDVSDTLPEIMAPPTLDDGQSLTDVAPAPAPRVAPEPAAAPEPEAEEAPEVVEETAPDPAAETVVEEADAAAPEEATTEIVTEAEEEADLAPTASLRPRSRPSRPAPEPEPEEPAEDPTAAAVAAAVAEANQPSDAPSDAPSGPPLNAGEKEGFAVAVRDCWNVNVGSEASRVIVTVGFSLNQDGSVNGAVRLISAEGGSGGAQESAFQAARRAVLRCPKGGGGYKLPAEKYEQWRDVEIVFNPERMSIK